MTAGEYGPKDAWNKHVGVSITEASIAHTYYWTFKTFLDTLIKYIFILLIEFKMKILEQYYQIYVVYMVYKE